MPPLPNERQAIANLQRYLRQLSYDDPAMPKPPIDGIFGSDTKNALRAFQAAEGLPATGVADRRTWNLLYRRYRESLRAHSAPLPISQFPRLSQGFSVKEGDECFLVALIQYALTELSLLYDGMEELTQSGLFDGATAAAVRMFQQKQGLPVTGEVDRNTWDALAEMYNRTFGGLQDQ